MLFPALLSSLLVISVSAHRSGLSGSNKTCECYDQVLISSKETTICETTPGVKAFAGYVHLPSTILADSQDPTHPYNISTFFWFFQARHSPESAPLVIYLDGGPGESSMFGATQENGPCNINPDSNSTTLNPFSLNNYANVLYIDQPVSVGFSYQTLINSTNDLLELDYAVSPIVPVAEYNGSVPPENMTFQYGLYPDQDPTHTSSTTNQAARQLWHFMQAWLTEFREHTSSDDRISLVANSYGGYTGVGVFQYFQQQNVRIRNGEICGYTIHLDNLGITNGCIDQLYQIEFYPQFSYNNTYGVQLISQETYENVTAEITIPGGCRDLIVECRELAALGDPEELGLNTTVNNLCAEATLCLLDLEQQSFPFNTTFFQDISEAMPPALPTSYTAGYMQQAWVQLELGVPLEFTATSTPVVNKFLFTTGDACRFEGMKGLEYLLDQGIKVVLVYGDRDFDCNWLAIESLSLTANWTGALTFQHAGYANLTTNKTYTGGVVRQSPSLSFARVFQAGHDVSYWQPQTVYEIFNRALFGKDIATGAIDITSQYSTTGPESSFGFQEVLRPLTGVLCYVWNAAQSCTVEQIAALELGTAEVVDGVVVAPAS